MSSTTAPICLPCARSFNTEDALSDHIRDSPKHRTCSKCLQPYHVENPKQPPPFLCTKCIPSKQETVFKSPSAAVQQAAARVVQKITSSDPSVYIGTPSYLVKIVWNAANTLRKKKNPTLEKLLVMTSNCLSPDISKSILSGALRYNPVDQSAEGKRKRRAEEKERSEAAERAERHFLQQIIDAGYKFRSEEQILKEHKTFVKAKKAERKELKDNNKIMSKDENEAYAKAIALPITPDVLFNEPANIAGKTCYWLEYKCYFGFTKDAFVAKKIRMQVKKYAERFGPGGLVFRHGYEMGYLDMGGVEVFRQAELIESLSPSIPEKQNS